MVKSRNGESVRLSKSNQYENTSLVQIEGVNTKERWDGTLVKGWRTFTRRRRRRTEPIIAAFGAKSHGLMEIVALSGLNSNPTCLRSPW
ncbi:60S ribosomal protein L35a-3 [Platanthera zijinensis]|uniref:60S ribosomal protein L35a-3 n=1 Tax=Platanthera zijinensis TaxID=2320716 RepID=A0AAP0BGQ0_9ASPA